MVETWCKIHGSCFRKEQETKADGGIHVRVDSEEAGRRMRKLVKKRTQEDDRTQGMDKYQRVKESKERIRREE